MKPKTFELEKGKYAVVATYLNHNDTTGEDDENTIRTYERPRPKLYDEMATLALLAREYWKLADLKLRVTKIGFTENKDGHFVRFSLASVDDVDPLKIGPLKLKRQLEFMPGTEDRDPESRKNPLLDSVDLIENKITEYLNGDREQAKLPLKTEAEPVPKQGRLFGVFRGRKAATPVS
ncbi:MAG: hypothetical protein ACLQMF_20050 [Rectinemataceae bacterium]